MNGEVFRVDTSFRTWMKFERLLLEEGLAWDGIFADRVPDDPEWVDAAVEFLASENATPRSAGPRQAKAVDLLLDGDYVVASFQQAYGIDLTAGDMHWHRFKALLNGLPEGTVLSRIASYRTWTPKKAEHDSEMRRLREAWALPDADEDRRRQEALDAFDEWASTGGQPTSDGGCQWQTERSKSA